MATAHRITADFYSSWGTWLGRYSFETESEIPPWHISLPSGQLLHRTAKHAQEDIWRYTEVEDENPIGCVEVQVVPVTP